MKLLAYHGDPKIKEHYLSRVRAHAAADEILHGRFWEGGKGCAVGCTIHSADHARYETELGIPRQIAHLEDQIFEMLWPDIARKWPERFLAAIPVGADLAPIIPEFLIWTLTDPKDGILALALVDDHAMVLKIAELYERRLKGDEPTDSDWNAAGDALSKAPDSNTSHTARAVWEAREAGSAKAAARAAWVALEAWAVQDDDAEEKFPQRQADKLIDLLKAVPV